MAQATLRWPPCAGVPAPGEFDGFHLAQTYNGIQMLNWFARYLRDQPVSTGPSFEYYRPWVRYGGSGPDGGVYAKANGYPAAAVKQFDLSGAGALVPHGSPIAKGTTSLTTFPATQSQDPGGQLVLFAKLYNVAPNGSQVLPDKLVSPLRVANVNRPITISLPGLVYRFPAGHRIRLVLAQGDANFAGNNQIGQVTVADGSTAKNALNLPVAGDRRGTATRH